MKTLPLVNWSTLVAVVDDADYETAVQHTWYAHFTSATTYAKTFVKVDGKWQSLYLHNLVMGVKGIDHINHDGLNCRRENLRVATATQNMGNSRFKVGKYGYRGVSKLKHSRYYAYIHRNNIKYHLGYYDTVEEAAQAYDKAAVAHFGAFATLNLPGA